MCRVKTNEARGFVSRFPVFWTGADVFMAFYGHGDAGAVGHQAGSQDCAWVPASQKSRR